MEKRQEEPASTPPLQWTAGRPAWGGQPRSAPAWGQGGARRSAVLSFTLFSKCPTTNPLGLWLWLKIKCSDQRRPQREPRSPEETRLPLCHPRPAPPRPALGGPLGSRPGPATSFGALRACRWGSRRAFWGLMDGAGLWGDPPQGGHSSGVRRVLPVRGETRDLRERAWATVQPKAGQRRPAGGPGAGPC